MTYKVRECCPNCGRGYDDIDFDYQSCSKCGWDNEREVFDYDLLHIGMGIHLSPEEIAAFAKAIHDQAVDMCYEEFETWYDADGCKEWEKSGVRVSSIDKVKNMLK